MPAFLFFAGFFPPPLPTAPLNPFSPPPPLSPQENTPFRRVRVEEVKVNPELMDNSYEGTFGNTGWGAKASEKLSVTRGKSFRHEKTKKKRGSYRGGAIDRDTVNSFKFGDDW